MNSDLEITFEILIEAYRNMLIDPCDQTISEYDDACREMEIAMETGFSVGNNAIHVRFQDE